MSVLTSPNVQPSERSRAIRILASSIARELKQRGYDPRHVVGLACELISLACESIRSRPGETEVDEVIQS